MVNNFLLVSDDNYFPGLIAQINSIYAHSSNPNIYVVEKISEKNKNFIRDYVKKIIPYNESVWEDVDKQKGHISRTVMGKYQMDEIEESHILYLDTDAILNSPVASYSPETMILDVRHSQLLPTDRYFDAKTQLQRVIQERGGVIESGDAISLFLDGAYIAKVDWIREVLHPAIKSSIPLVPETNPKWLSMGFFQLAVGLLNRPVSNWELKQYLTGMNNPFSVDDSNIIHFLGRKKPWNDYPDSLEKQIWDHYFNDGLISIPEN